MYGVTNSNVGGFAADVASRHQQYQDAQNAKTQRNILKRGNLLSQAGFKQMTGSAEKHAGFEESGFATLEGGGTFSTVKAVGRGLKKVAGKIRDWKGANRVGPEDDDVPEENDYEMETTGWSRSPHLGQRGVDINKYKMDPDTIPKLGRQGDTLPSDYDDTPSGNLGASTQATTDAASDAATGGITDLGESATLDTVLEGVGGLFEAAAGPLGLLMGGYALYSGIKDLVEGGEKEQQGEDIDKKANAMVTAAKPAMQNSMDKYIAPVSSAI